MVFPDQFWALNLLMTLFGLAALLVIYKVFSLLDSPIIAFQIVAATAASYVFYRYSHRILTDAPFAMLFWTMLYTALRYQRSSRWWLLPTALLAIMCVCVRAPGVILIGPAAVALALDRSSGATLTKRLSLAAAILFAAAVSAAAFYLYARSAIDYQPHYAGFVTKFSGHAFSYHFLRFFKSLPQVPVTVARVLFSQRGLVFDQMGLAATFLALIGSVVLFRRRLRLIPVVVVGYPLAMIILTGRVPGLLERYYMPYHPLLAYAVIQGLAWLIAKLRQLPTAPPPDSLVLRTARIAAILFIACNAPRLARDAFYHSYLSHTPRFYSVYQSGRYAELHDLAEIVRASPATSPVGMLGREDSTLHFLSRRPVLLLDHLRERPLSRPDTVFEIIRSHPDLQIIVFEIKGERSDFLQRLDAGAKAANFTTIFRADHFLAWQRPPAPSTRSSPPQ